MIIRMIVVAQIFRKLTEELQDCGYDHKIMQAEHGITIDGIKTFRLVGEEYQIVPLHFLARLTIHKDNVMHMVIE